MAGKRISVRIDEHLEKQLKRRAASVRVDESEIVRQALTEFLLKDEPQETAYSLLKKGRLIGIISPSDINRLLQKSVSGRSLVPAGSA